MAVEGPSERGRGGRWRAGTAITEHHSPPRLTRDYAQARTRVIEHLHVRDLFDNGRALGYEDDEGACEGVKGCGYARMPRKRSEVARGCAEGACPLGRLWREVVRQCAGRKCLAPGCGARPRGNAWLRVPRCPSCPLMRMCADCAREPRESRAGGLKVTQGRGRARRLGEGRGGGKGRGGGTGETGGGGGVRGRAGGEVGGGGGGGGGGRGVSFTSLALHRGLGAGASALNVHCASRPHPTTTRSHLDGAPTASLFGAGFRRAAPHLRPRRARELPPEGDLHHGSGVCARSVRVCV